MKKINTILKTIITETQRKEYEVFLKIEEKWEKEIEKNIKKAAKIIDYKDNTIIIKTKNPSWKNEINFMKSQLKKNYRQQNTLLIK
tara:strand:+ start:211 stop:468 length:258 start_codon:yes stop_codon:yes gene_type:complete